MVILSAGMLNGARIKTVSRMVEVIKWLIIYSSPDLEGGDRPGLVGKRRTLKSVEYASNGLQMFASFRAMQLGKHS